MKIVLASASPRRREILSKLGYEYEIIAAKKEEKTDKTLPDEVVKELALNKALEVRDYVKDKSVIIAADTVVFFENEILGKPKNRQDAFRMIKLISGHTHQVYTGVAIIDMQRNEIISFSEKTDVYVKKMLDIEIEEYVDSGEGDDKAGSYAIQGLFSEYIYKFDGDYDNVVGLPGSKVDKILKQIKAKEE